MVYLGHPALGTRKIQDISDYVLNNVRVWDYPVVSTESTEQSEDKQKSWSKNIQMLDTALLSLLGTEDISISEIPDALDAILQSSLWQRCLNRRGDSEQALFNSILSQRSSYIWDATTSLQRRGYFLAGVGLETGLQLDAISEKANELLINTNAYIVNKEDQLAIETIIQLAELVFDIPAFLPSRLPDNWRGILTAWLKGEILTEGDFTDIDDALQFVEDGLVYRLTWGLEAIRVRVQANEDDIEDVFRVDTHEFGLVVPAIEYGTLSRSASLLMQSGFSSRKAALNAISSTNAAFSNGTQFREWLQSDTTSELSAQSDWPTSETSILWHNFVREYQTSSNSIWSVTSKRLPAIWLAEYEPVSGSPVKILNYETGETEVVGSDGEKIGLLMARYQLLSTGIYYATIANDTDYLAADFYGSGENPFEESSS